MSVHRVLCPVAATRYCPTSFQPHTGHSYRSIQSYVRCVSAEKKKEERERKNIPREQSWLRENSDSEQKSPIAVDDLVTPAAFYTGGGSQRVVNGSCTYYLRRLSLF
jgi:hypothetical protein